MFFYNHLFLPSLIFYNEVIFLQYREFINEKGERLWLPIIAGAAILSAPFWINGNNKCCGGNYNYYSAPAPNQYQPYPVYQTNYYPVYTYPYNPPLYNTYYPNGYNPNV